MPILETCAILEDQLQAVEWYTVYSDQSSFNKLLSHIFTLELATVLYAALHGLIQHHKVYIFHLQVNKLKRKMRSILVYQRNILPLIVLKLIKNSQNIVSPEDNEYKAVHQDQLMMHLRV